MQAQAPGCVPHEHLSPLTGENHSDKKMLFIRSRIFSTPESLMTLTRSKIHHQDAAGS